MGARRESLARLTIDSADIRFPEWVRILEKVLEPGECVAAFYPHRLPDRTLWLGIRVAVMITQAPNHVVAVWRHSDDRSLRVYDNDSHARTQGTYTLLGVGVRWRGRAVAVMQEDSPLHRIALEHIPLRRMTHAAPVLGAQARERRSVIRQYPHMSLHCQKVYFGLCAVYESVCQPKGRRRCSPRRPAPDGLPTTASGNSQRTITDRTSDYIRAATKRVTPQSSKLGDCQSPS